MRITQTERAWAAGFFDGEGSVFITNIGRNKDYPYPRVLIGQNDRRVLDRFKAVIGEGRIRGPYAYKNRPRTKPMFLWGLFGYPQIGRLARTIGPWLSPQKKRQFRACGFVVPHRK